MKRPSVKDEALKWFEEEARTSHALWQSVAHHIVLILNAYHPKKAVEMLNRQANRCGHMAVAASYKGAANSIRRAQQNLNRKRARKAKGVSK